MTTKVTVDAHAGWDVGVLLRVGEPSQVPELREEIVPAGTVREFYIHSGLRIVLIEEITNA